MTSAPEAPVNADAPLRLAEDGRTWLAPAEHVLTLAVDLPLATRAARAAAAPFAVEPFLAEPLERVHVVLGPEIARRRHLVAVVSRARLQGWVSALAASGAPDARIEPDALRLPVPAPGSWATRRVEGRVLVRRDDGSAFAAADAAFETLWRAAGAPPLEASAEPARAVATLSLRSGPFAPRGARLDGLVGRAAAILLAGFGALAAIGAADASALSTLAQARRAEARAILLTLAPERAGESDLSLALLAVASETQTRTRDRFLPMLSRAATALLPEREGLALRALRYDAASGSLRLSLEAADLAALQRIEAAAAQAGFEASLGAATVSAGAAAAELTLRERAVRA